VVYWIGDINTLKKNGSCPEEATLAVGKRFLRYVELTLVLDERFENPKIGMGMFEKKDISLIL